MHFIKKLAEKLFSLVIWILPTEDQINKFLERLKDEFLIAAFGDGKGLIRRLVAALVTLTFCIISLAAILLWVGAVISVGAFLLSVAVSITTITLPIILIFALLSAIWGVFRR